VIVARPQVATDAIARSSLSFASLGTRNVANSIVSSGNLAGDQSSRERGRHGVGLYA
jgi:hypothetical protein